MAEFLTTRRAVAELEDLIRNADETLILVAPHLKLSKESREWLLLRDKQNKKTTVIYGKQELSREEHAFINSLNLVTLNYYRDLRATCYVNDKRMIIASLNFYEHSTTKTKEMGVLIDKSDPADLPVYAAAMEEINLVLENSVPSGPGAKGLLKSANQKAEEYPAHGFCIRTGIAIPFDPEKPLCHDAFLAWSEQRDVDHPERYCHFTGEVSNGETCVAYPIMNNSWKKARQVHNF
jgi:hypothetical protein